MNTILPRLIRLRDAPNYLGMDRNRFNTEVRPQLIEIPIGTQGVAFDRLDLDAWVDHYKGCSGRPAVLNRRELWDAKYRQDLSKEVSSGTLKKEYSDAEFEKALELTYSVKQSDISTGGSRK